MKNTPSVSMYIEGVFLCGTLHFGKFAMGYLCEWMFLMEFDRFEIESIRQEFCSA